MVDRGKGRAPSKGASDPPLRGVSEPPVSDEIEIARPRTNLGLGPARNEALRVPPPPEEPIEPVPEDFAQRLGLPDNDAPLPRDTAVLNLDVVWRSAEDSNPPRTSSAPDDDEEDDLEDELLGDAPLPQDDLPDDIDTPPPQPKPPTSHARAANRSKPVPARSSPKAAEPLQALSEAPEVPDVLEPAPTSLPRAAAMTTAVLPLVIVIVGLIAGYLFASLLLDACSGR